MRQVSDRLILLLLSVLKEGDRQGGMAVSCGIDSLISLPLHLGADAQDSLVNPLLATVFSSMFLTFICHLASFYIYINLSVPSP